MVEYSLLFVTYIIPSLLGIATGIIYAMFFMKGDDFHPRKEKGEGNEPTVIRLGWINYAFSGGIGGLFTGMVLSLLEVGHISIFILSVIGSFLYCKYVESKIHITL